MAEFKVRVARVDDCDEILRLIKGLAEFEKKLHLLRTDTETLKRNGFGEDKVFHCFVAEARDHKGTDRPLLVGYLLYVWCFFSLSGRVLYVEDLYVDEDYRRKGVGSALWACAMKVALDKRSAQMQWCVTGWNTSAINFYKTLGSENLGKNEEYISFMLNKDSMKSAYSRISRD
ncbi:thialysine N-epsilon-acetyltransferase-like [Haliotis rufescens]|uniref:thialysine N-epsilon-acetyltransferase-like n=1 Tax=Haliotis rufescens TaxID=6454 RepID=UPI00201F0D16|nr:thialysine N-epsilon-acetyltransferase-like [Haliotis rufescens]